VIILKAYIKIIKELRKKNQKSTLVKHKN